MTVPCFTLNEFIDYIKGHGWEIVNDNFWESDNRLIFKKAVLFYTFQCQEKYFYTRVVKTCEILNIDPPKEHIHAYYQHNMLLEKECYCKSDKIFKECCGKT